MGNIAISVENLGKRYRIGRAEQRPQNLREALSAYAGSPFRYLRSRLREPGEDEMIWALKDVSFEVKHGEVLGIIGRNGAGKSTLLKILSRITEPTEGCAKVYGRVGSLLEVGTGFHPELTGRENIYLSGAILGMRRVEVDRRFDEIVEFSGIDQFIDTPVKRYSSGMFVRLGFATAIHMNPDLLLIDEVLAVGDFRFQDKCAAKIQELRKQGMTMLVVSHQRHMIEKLCRRVIFLQKGALKYIGGTEKAMDTYFHSIFKEASGTTAYSYNTPGVSQYAEREVHIIAVVIVDKDGKERDLFIPGEELRLQIYFQVNKPLPSAVVYARIFPEGAESQHGLYVHGSNTARFDLEINYTTGEYGMAEIHYDQLHLLDGRYFFNVGILKDYFSLLSYDQKEQAAFFTVGNSHIHDGVGIVHLQHTWAISKIPGDKVP